MKVKYYVDENNNFLGGMDYEPPAGSKEVPVPNDGRDKWDGAKWEPHQEPYGVARKREYEKEGVTLEAMVIALWESDPLVIADLESKRQSVKTRVPKPAQE